MENVVNESVSAIKSTPYHVMKTQDSVCVNMDTLVISVIVKLDCTIVM